MTVIPLPRASRPSAGVAAPLRSDSNNQRSPRLLSIRAAAAELGVSSWTLRDLIASGKLRAVQPPGVRRIWLDRRDIDRAIEAWKS